MKHDHIFRKSFLIYLLQIPFVGGIAKSLHIIQAEKRYLINKFAVVGFCFYEGEENLDQMKIGHNLALVSDPKK